MDNNQQTTTPADFFSLDRDARRAFLAARRDLLTIEQYRWARRTQNNSTNQHMLARADEKLFRHYAALRILQGG